MPRPARPYLIEYRLTGPAAAYARRLGFPEWRVKGRYRQRRDREQAWTILARRRDGYEYRKREQGAET